METRGRKAIEDRVRSQFPGLVITLVSILIGLVLADLVAEARLRMILWPLTIQALTTWAQLTTMACMCVSAWIVYSHLAMTQHSVPSLSDSLIAFLVPVPLLIMTGLTGRSETWPWFIGGGLFVLVATVTTVWQTRLAMRDPNLQGLSHILRWDGCITVTVVACPVCFGIAWASYNGWWPDYVEALLTLSTAPASVTFTWLFVRDWRNSLKAVKPASTRTPAAGRVAKVDKASA